MDPQTLKSVTRALDIAIDHVAKEQRTKLRDGRTDQQTAREILRSLRSLESLQAGSMPRYNEWDALCYAIWYHPAHVNLAYSLIRRIPSDKNPLMSGWRDLQVLDFGCGTLAMQFGLALAAADALEEQRVVGEITIISEDSSEAMVNIGWDIWNAFVREINEYPAIYGELDALRQVCGELKFMKIENAVGTSWLSVLHVAYEKKLR